MTKQNETTVERYLTNVTGGFAGVDHNFDIDDIIWRFDDVNSVLLVKNNNTDDTLEDSLDSGTYSQHILKDNEGNLFLFIDNIDNGLVTLSEDQQTFTLNQNIKSTGNGNDGFIYSFDKQIIIIN